MASLKDIHSVFLKEIVESSKLIPHVTCSILPSILFLVSVFLLLYFRFHQYENIFSKWYSKLYKELLFHWTYFYSTRLWFVFLKICKWIMHNGDRILAEKIYDVKINKHLFHFAIIFLVLVVAVIPCLILIIRYFDRMMIPRFLIGVVVEDPWMRSEIGTAGHYLERPPQSNFLPYNKQNLSYRSKRSSSVDTNVYLFKQPFPSRPSRSVQDLVD